MKHYFFYKWAEYEAAGQVEKLLDLVRHIEQTTNPGPLLVHCKSVLTHRAIFREAIYFFMKTFFGNSPGHTLSEILNY